MKKYQLRKQQEKGAKGSIRRHEGNGQSETWFRKVEDTDISRKHSRQMEEEEEGTN